MGDVVDVRSGKDYKHLSEGNIPVYGTGGFMLNVNQALSYDEDAIGIGRKGTIDKPYILKAPFWTVDTLFYAIPREKVDLNFAFDVFQNIDWKKKDESTGVPSLSKTAINEIDVLVPQYDEQQPLGQFFNRIDNLITLHQREFAFLCKEKSKKFRYIKNAWEQRKFGEVFDCTVPNNTLSRAELSYDEGTVLNVHYGDVLIKYGSVLDVQKDDIPRIPHRCREDFNGALLQDGDVIIADTAEDETTGKACEIGNLQGSAIVSGLHTMVCRPRNRMALGYLGYYLNSNAYHHQLLPLMQGIKVLSLSRSNIQKTSVSYPSAMKEQQLIASYFSQLDHLITLHQCKCQIDGCRFQSPLAITWEQRKLGEIGSVSMCRRIFKEQTSENGEIPFYKIGTFGGEADAFISRELFEEYKAKYQYPKKGDILISASGSIGRTVVFTGKNEYFQDSNIVWLNHDKHLDNSFLKCFYSIVKWAGIEGSTIKRLYNDNILNTAITLPSVEEQQKIGAYFENLDNLITLHQCE